MSTNKRLVYILLLLVLGTGLIACTGPAVEAAAGSGNTAVLPGGITVIGQGQASGQPDKANATVGVEIFAPTVSEATSQNQAIIEQILAALAQQGIDEKDIQTTNYNMWAEQIYGDKGPEGISGYRVTNMVNITIRDINQVSDVLAAATEAGANSINGVYFSVEDTAVLEADARAAAMDDARARAQSLAELAGVELGEVHMITEVVGANNYPMPMMGGGFDMAIAESAAPSISPGQLNFSTQIQVTFAIK